MPLSKARSQWFRASKALDGTLVMATNVTGLALAPFTFGLSTVIAGQVQAGLSGVCSVLTSLTKKERLSSSLTRAGIRMGHASVEALIPGASQVNAFYTSVDDLRVAFKFTEVMNKLRRGGPVKARWETLGSPDILWFLRDRYQYISQGLLPRALFILHYGQLQAEDRLRLEKIVEQLHDAKLSLFKSLERSKMRYEYLLKSGKIPNQFVASIVLALDREEKTAKVYSSEAYSLSSLWAGMKKEALD
jgi:hypothetical protein